MLKTLTIVEWGMFGLMPVGFYLLIRAIDSKSPRFRFAKALLAGIFISAPFLYLVAWELLLGTVFEIPSNLRIRWRGSSIVLTAVIALGIICASCWEVLKGGDKRKPHSTHSDSHGHH